MFKASLTVSGSSVPFFPRGPPRPAIGLTIRPILCFCPPIYIPHFLPSVCKKINRYFPYEEFRTGQREFMEALCNSLINGGLSVIEAPNGIGKTPGILATLSYLANEYSLSFLYFVRTHRQIDRVIEECKRIPNLRVVAIRGKGELCENEQVRTLGNYTLINAKCNFLRETGECDLYSATSKESFNFTRCYDPITDYRGSGCPYYDTLRVIRKIKCPVIVLSYNYLLNPEIGEEFLGSLLNEDLSIIVDEAHNLKRYWLDRYIKRVELDLLGYNLGSRAPKICYAIYDLINSFKRSKLDSLMIPKEYIKSKLIKCLDSLKSLVDLQDAGYLLRELIADVDRSRFVLLEEGRMLLALESVLKFEELIERYRSVSLISGTWGGRHAVDMEFSKRPNFIEIPLQSWGITTVSITRDFTTRYVERRKSEYYRLATVLADVSNYVAGNMGIFTASYEILNGIISVGFEHLVNKPVFVESRDFNAWENRILVEKFKKFASSGAILLGVQGGRNSEGEDFPGLQMTTSIVVGLQLPRPGLESNLFRIYWAEMYGLFKLDVLYSSRAAFQAAARPVRGPKDIGFIVFADKRFLNREIIRMMPKWIRHKVEPVSLEELPDKAREFFNEIRRSHYGASNGTTNYR